MNTDLMNAVADRIEARPETYNQAAWCGTSCCVAGHVASIEGWQHHDRSKVRKGEDVEYVDIVACDALGIPMSVAVHLFAGDWEPSRGVSVPEQLRRYASGEDSILKGGS